MIESTRMVRDTLMGIGIPRKAFSVRGRLVRPQMYDVVDVVVKDTQPFLEHINDVAKHYNVVVMRSKSGYIHINIDTDISTPSGIIEEYDFWYPEIMTRIGVRIQTMSVHPSRASPPFQVGDYVYLRSRVYGSLAQPYRVLAVDEEIQLYTIEKVDNGK